MKCQEVKSDNWACSSSAHSTEDIRLDDHRLLRKQIKNLEPPDKFDYGLYTTLAIRSRVIERNTNPSKSQDHSVLRSTHSSGHDPSSHRKLNTPKSC